VYDIKKSFVCRKNREVNDVYTTKQLNKQEQLTALLRQVQEQQAASNTPQDFDFYNECLNRISLQLDLLRRE
jgi:hypothetical protein